MPNERPPRAWSFGAARSHAALLGAFVFAIGCARGSELTGIAGGGGAGTGTGGTGTGTGSGTGTTSSAGGTSGTTSSSGTSTGSQTGSSQGGAGGSAPKATSCPPKQFITGLDGDGKAVCAPIDDAAKTAITGACAVYFGWNDECGGCTTAPTKWGFAKTATCMNGVGVNDTCTTPTLGGQAVQLFGLNMDGDVNDDDKFHVGLHCSAGDATTSAGPCGPGEFVTAVSNNQVTCSPASGAVLDYVRASCSIYMGWRDSCDACTSVPAKWGYASTLGCQNGLGAGNTCTTAMLGGTAVQLFGLSTGGDVDGNDKLYVGLRCVEPPPKSGSVMGSCPAGQLATGIEENGSIVCESPAPLVAGWFRQKCSLYFGWRDSCDGCTTAPSKWGKVRDGNCVNGVGVDSTCTMAILGSETVSLFGLNTDGDVGGDDKLYVGFGCF